MEIKHEQVRNTLRAWAAEIGQRRVAELVTAAYHRRNMTTPRLGIIERADGTIDFDAWHNNKQQLFRWLDGDSARCRGISLICYRQFWMPCRLRCVPRRSQGTALSISLRGH